MPTGIHLRDVRKQLFSAAERVLRRDGPHALTSRAVTTEADCAKGVLHRHFADFDAFLAELVLDRIAQVRVQAAELRAAAGTGTVAGNLADALKAQFAPVAAAIVALITFRDDLRRRLREARQAPGVPLATEIVEMVVAYLEAERDLGRIAPDTDLPGLALSLVGGGHLLLADRGTPPEADAVENMIATVLAGALKQPDHLRRRRGTHSDQAFHG